MFLTGVGTSSNGNNSTSLCALSSNKTVYLSTAMVKVQSIKGIELGRMLFDQGSEVSLVTREFCSYARLNVIQDGNVTKLYGIIPTPMVLKGVTRFCVKI